MELWFQMYIFALIVQAQKQFFRGLMTLLFLLKATKIVLEIKTYSFENRSFNFVKMEKLEFGILGCEKHSKVTKINRISQFFYFWQNIRKQHFEVEAVGDDDRRRRRHWLRRK